MLPALFPCLQCCCSLWMVSCLKGDAQTIQCSSWAQIHPFVTKAMDLSTFSSSALLPLCFIAALGFYDYICNSRHRCFSHSIVWLTVKWILGADACMWVLSFSLLTHFLRKQQIVCLMCFEPSKGRIQAE